jgi:hypothetical protein
MEAGGLEEARARRARTPQEPQTMCSFLLDLVHDDYSPYYSLRCIPSDKCMQNPRMRRSHTLSVNALPSRSESASIRALGV